MASQYNGTTSALLSQAQSSISNALMIAARIGGTRTPNLKERRFSHDVRAINLDPPPKFSDVFDGADSSDALIAGLNDKVDAWLAKYFPSINGQFHSRNKPANAASAILEPPDSAENIDSPKNMRPAATP